MKAPDKLTLNGCLFSDIGILGIEEEVEYIRKDTLLEWAKENLCNSAYLQLIDKLNSM